MGRQNDSNYQYKSEGEKQIKEMSVQLGEFVPIIRPGESLVFTQSHLT